MGKEIGIDFGTTTTEVSYIDKKGYSRSLRLEEGSYIIPTVIFFKSQDEYIIGKMANIKGRKIPQAAIKNFKLFLTDPNKKYKIVAENGDRFTVKPIKAAQLFLNKLIQIIQPKLLSEFKDDGTIEKAVITVPAQFDPEEKYAIKNAIMKSAKQAGFSDIKLAAEPTAAAVAYQDENCEDGESILVYDFGGGTFDVSVIKKVNDVYTEIATDGDKRLGGNLLTEKIAKVIWKKCLDETNRDYPFDEDEVATYLEEDYDLSINKFLSNRNEVFLLAEELKISFLEDDEANGLVNFYYNNDSEPMLINVDMTLNEFYKIIDKDIQKTVDLTVRVAKQTLEEGGISKIDQLVLAGGSSQIRLIKDKFIKNPMLKDLVGEAGDSSTLISRGAAKLASAELKVEEKTRFEIGTRLIKGVKLDLFETVIKAGEKIPCSGTQVFYLSRNNQKDVTIEYYEKDVKNYPKASCIDDEGINLVNELSISGIPPKDGLSLWVTFSIVSDGTPTISAEIKDQNNNIVKSDKLTITKGGNLY